MKIRHRLRRRSSGRLRALPINRLIPNVLTVLALAAGMTALRFGLEGRWDLAIGMVVLAAVLDGLDGRIARLIGGTSGFGAQLDSLSDVIAFGVAPGVLVHQFALKGIGGLGWIVALVYVTCCALRLARFNARLNDPDLPPWAYNFFSGVPAPAGAGLAILPMILAQQFPGAFFAHPLVNAVWLIAVAAMMISSIPTYAFKKLRVPQSQVPLALLGVGVLAAGGVSEPWLTLVVLGLVYIALIPLGIRSYRRLAAEATRLKAQRDGVLLSLPEERGGSGR
ncbi:MAG: phosphatidylcholine/phosphatidylserine synthase [Alphaproteobacteria bacterium]|nr:phosphatidylcholine/phosphatidylserine synthase [Alphaproteobacteria bacterium]